MFLQSTYDESIIPELEDLLRAAGINASFYNSTLSTIEFEVDDSGEADIQIYVTETTFQVYELGALVFEISRKVLH